MQDIHLYRNIQFTRDGVRLPWMETCQCQCEKNSCSGLDAITMYGERFGHGYFKFNSKKSQPCAVCQGIIDALVTYTFKGSADFQRDTLLPPLQKNFESLETGFAKFEKANAQAEEATEALIRSIQKKRQLFGEQAEKIRALKEKVRVANDMMQNSANKLQTMDASLTTLKQQNEKQYVDKVPVGVPFFPPLFHLSNRNYVIMMLCINALLVVLILYFSFKGRRKFKFDLSKNSKSSSTAPASKDLPPSAAQAPSSTTAALPSTS